MTSFMCSKSAIRSFISASKRQSICNAYFAITLFFVVFINSFTLNAAEFKVLALVSDRSAVSMVAGAHQFLAMQEIAKTGITIRSVSQLNQLTNSQIQQLINKHQALLVAGVFGESVERLLTLKYQSQQTRLMLNTDRRLMALHHDKQGGRRACLGKILKALSTNCLYLFNALFDLIT